MACDDPDDGEKPALESDLDAVGREARRLVGRARRKKLSPEVSRLLPDGTDVIFDLPAGDPGPAPVQLTAGALFSRPVPLEMEIGPGKGEFVMEMARTHPEVGFLAVEYKRTRVERIAGRVVRAGLANIRLVWSDAREVVALRLPPGSLRAIYVNFPDPWPKRRHRRRRLLSDAFLRCLATALEPGGTLTFGTDVADYAEQVVGSLESSGQWENVHGRAVILHRIEGYAPTVFEARFRQQGLSVHFVRYRRTEQGQAGDLGCR